MAASATHAAAQTRAQAIAQHVHGQPPSPLSGSHYAGFVTRLIAFAIDAAIVNVVALMVAVVVTLVFSVIPESRDSDKLVVAIGGIAFALWSIGYFLTFWTTTGQTPGYRAMQIKVTREDGARLRPRHAIARLVGIVLSLPLFVGFIPILFTRRRRGLPDWLSGTVVRIVPDADASQP
jgi:uncharacterized RDD family membrane protein YckC